MASTLEYMDFSLDSRIRASLLSEIKARHLCRLEDDELIFVNAAGDPAGSGKGADSLARYARGTDSCPLFGTGQEPGEILLFDDCGKP